MHSSRLACYASASVISLSLTGAGLQKGLDGCQHTEDLFFVQPDHVFNFLTASAARAFIADQVVAVQELRKVGATG